MKSVSVDGWLAQGNGGLPGKADSVILFSFVDFVKELFLPASHFLLLRLSAVWVSAARVFSCPRSPAKSVSRDLEVI